MTYSLVLNSFLSSFTDLTDESKVEKLKELETGELLTLLRNIEERSRSYTYLVIKGVYGELFSRGIICI